MGKMEEILKIPSRTDQSWVKPLNMICSHKHHPLFSGNHPIKGIEETRKGDLGGITIIFITFRKDTINIL